LPQLAVNTPSRCLFDMQQSNNETIQQK
jgi:hypothetical protein